MAKDKKKQWRSKAGVVLIFAIWVGLGVWEARAKSWKEGAGHRAELREKGEGLDRGDRSWLQLVDTVTYGLAWTWRRRKKSAFRLGWPRPFGDLVPRAAFRNVGSLLREVSGR